MGVAYLGFGPLSLWGPRVNIRWASIAAELRRDGRWCPTGQTIPARIHPAQYTVLSHSQITSPVPPVHAASGNPVAFRQSLSPLIRKVTIVFTVDAQRVCCGLHGQPSGQYRKHFRGRNRMVTGIVDGDMFTCRHGSGSRTVAAHQQEAAVNSVPLAQRLRRSTPATSRRRWPNSGSTGNR